jgi:flagellar basal body rod protein FlgG
MPGYKRQELSLEAVRCGILPGASANGKDGPQSFVVPEAESVTNFEEGELKSTGVSTDAAIDGEGFFNVQLPGGTTAYTRAGDFHVNATGQLVTTEGYPVLGNGGPIQLDRTKHQPVSISATGEVSQGETVKGKVKVTDFNKLSLLTQASGSYFVAANKDLKEQPTTATLRQGYIEGSNVSSVSQMVSLLTAARGFEANQKLIQMEDDRMGHAIADLGNPS